MYTQYPLTRWKSNHRTVQRHKGMPRYWGIPSDVLREDTSFRLWGWRRIRGKCAVMLHFTWFLGRCPLPESCYSLFFRKRLYVIYSVFRHICNHIASNQCASNGLLVRMWWKRHKNQQKIFCLQFGNPWFIMVCGDRTQRTKKRTE